MRSAWDYTRVARRSSSGPGGCRDCAKPGGGYRLNTHKTYLRDLAQAGCPVIPTAWDVTDEETLVAHADAWAIPVDETEWVVKPAVSASSRDTARWSDVDDALAHSRSLVEAGRTAMLQPYIASVDDEGETRSSSSAASSRTPSSRARCSAGRGGASRS